MARYLVTGATGFLGGHLVDALVRRGDDVVALCRQAEPELEDKGAAVARGDVTDAASVRAAAEGVAGVFHCAGKVSRDPADTEELHRVHVDGTRAVLQASRAAGAARVVVASTSGTVAVSADPSQVSAEDAHTPLSIISRWPYYRTKLYAEQLALSASVGGFEVVSVNPTLLLGPGDERRSSTDDVRSFLDGRIPAIPGGGLSFVDVRDAAAGMVAAMERGAPGRRYLLSACNLPLHEFFARLARISGVRAPLVRVPRMQGLARPLASLISDVAAKVGGRWASGQLDPVSFEMAQYFWYVDASRAERELDWRPRDPTTTLRDTVEDILRSRGASLDA